MSIFNLKSIPLDEIMRDLKKTPLKGYDHYKIYSNSSIELMENVDPNNLVPAQMYVLTGILCDIERIRNDFLSLGIDILRLDCGYYFSNDESLDTPILQPIVEEMIDSNGRIIKLINDGMHRIYTAIMNNTKINILYIKNIPSEYPYYAYPLEDKWRDVSEQSTVPDMSKKKKYRIGNYRDLFRDFNEIYPGIQRIRN